MAVSVVLSREKFLEWLAGALLPRATSDAFLTMRHVGSNEILLVWQKESGPPDLNNSPILLVRADALREFFAFTSTYVSTYSPFSAFFRVVSVEAAYDLFETKKGGLNEGRIPEELTGIAIAEAYLQSGSNRKIQDISVQAGLATISSAVLAALARGYTRKHLEELFSSWNTTRALFNTDQLKFPIDTLAPFWSTVVDVISADQSSHQYNVYSQVIQFVRFQLANGFEPDSDHWRDITNKLPDELMRALKYEGTLSREDQVRKLDRSVSLLSEAKIEPLIREVLIGFLVARVSGGSIEYLKLCEPFSEKVPRAALWFALFASCWRENDVLVAGECLGRRLSRELLSKAGLFSTPTADINFVELDSRRINGRAVKLRTNQQTSISVELLPGVAARFKLPRPQPAKAELPLPIIEPESLRELRSILSRAIKLTERMEGQQPGLFQQIAGSIRKDRRPKSFKR